MPRAVLWNSPLTFWSAGQLHLGAPPGLIPLGLQQGAPIERMLDGRIESHSVRVTARSIAAPRNIATDREPALTGCPMSGTSSTQWFDLSLHFAGLSCCDRASSKQLRRTSEFRHAANNGQL